MYAVTEGFKISFKLSFFSPLRSGVPIESVTRSIKVPGNHERNCQTFSAKFLQFNTYKEFRASNKNKEKCLSRLQATNLEKHIANEKMARRYSPNERKGNNNDHLKGRWHKSKTEEVPICSVGLLRKAFRSVKVCSPTDVICDLFVRYNQSHWVVTEVRPMFTSFCYSKW